METVERQRERCGCRSVEECFHNLGAEMKALNIMVDAFAKAMKAKLRDKYLRDYYVGWDSRENREVIEVSLRKHVDRGGQWIDVANLAAMLWNMEM